MKVTVLNENRDINRYYVQSLCMIFFPGEKFSDKEEESPISIEVSFEDGDESCTAHARLCANGRSFL